MYYLLSIVFLYVGFLFSPRKKNRFFNLFLLLLPLSLLSILRGSVGTDTATYLSYFNSVINGYKSKDSYEPLFQFLIKLLSYFTSDANLMISLLAFIFTFILLVSAKNCEQDGSIFLLLIIPIYYIDLSMNALRIGLSFCVIYYSLKYMLTNKKFKYFIFTAIASLFQVSGFIISFVIYSLFNAGWRVVLVLSFFSLVGGYFFHDYFLIKFTSYSEMKSPSVFSGLSTLLLSLLLLLLWRIKLNSKFGPKNIYVNGFILSLSSYTLVFISYAGLRIQNLILLALILTLSVYIKRYNIYISKEAKIYMFLIGLLGFLFKLNNFYSGYGVGSSPFFPYEFIWQ